MRLGRWVSILSLCAGLVTTSSARVSFNLEKSFTVKGQLYGAYNHKFVDYDRDGIPEIVAWDATGIVVYSISGDSLIATIVPDTGWGQTLVFADVNRDSIPDIVTTRTKEIDFENYNLIVKMYDGASHFQITAEDTIVTKLSGYYGPGILGAFTCKDLDGDGYAELIISVDSVREDDSWAPMQVSWFEAGHTYCYYRFPDSLRWRSGYYFRSISSIPTSDDSIVFAGEHYNYRHQSHVGRGLDYNYYETFIQGISSNGSIKSLIGEYGDDYCSVSITTNVNYNSVRCFGRIDAASAEPNVLTQYHREYHASPLCGYYRDSLILYRLIDDSTTARVWASDLGTYTGASGYLYHPLLPGNFVAFASGRLTVFDGSTGVIIDSSAVLPSGYLYWDRTTADGVPRLVAISGMTVSIYSLDIVTGVDDGSGGDNLPNSFALNAIYPNPFNPSTTISFDLPKRAAVRLKVFDITGREVRTLVDGESSAGTYRIQWDGKNGAGQEVASGVYFFKLTATEFSQTRKGMLIK